MPLELLPPDVLLVLLAPDTIMNDPSIDTLAVFWSSICWLTSIFCTSRPVPSIMTFALVPGAGCRLNVCEKLLLEEVFAELVPPVVLEVLLPVVVLPPLLELLVLPPVVALLPALDELPEL